jgi:hypothetical protein
MSSSKAPPTPQEVSANPSTQYKSSEFEFPTSYEKVEAVKFEMIRERMFAKRVPD